MKKIFTLAASLCSLLCVSTPCNAETVKATPSQEAVSLQQLQQQFVDMRLGLFISFNMSSFVNDDWAPADAPASLFNPAKMDCNQWADAAKSANMTFGCLTTKHHSGFCLWDTKTTDYSVMSSPEFKRDVVKEYADAFRAKGLKVVLYYSILDLHHDIRPGFVDRKDVEMIKEQLTELLTSYGEVTALFIDGWDAPWSRISYDEVPFDDIYALVKSLQPQCLVMELNAAKYPQSGMFYTDIKSYEQNAGEHVSRNTNRLPALSSLPINKNWFWKTTFPTDPVKNAKNLVESHVIPLNNAHCAMLLNAAPNTDGLIDDNALQVLKEIGEIWNHPGKTPVLDPVPAPLTAPNKAKKQSTYSSYPYDIHISDFITDDSFRTYWQAHSGDDAPWVEVLFTRSEPINAIAISDAKQTFSDFKIEYLSGGKWYEIESRPDASAVKIVRFDRVWAEKVRLTLTPEKGKDPRIEEVCVYDERR